MQLVRSLHRYSYWILALAGVSTLASAALVTSHAVFTLREIRFLVSRVGEVEHIGDHVQFPAAAGMLHLIGEIVSRVAHSVNAFFSSTLRGIIYIGYNADIIVTSLVNQVK